jgi:SSS family transporter
MRPLDWIVLVASLAFIVVYGMWRGRGNQDLKGYFLANRSLPWYTVALSIMATQASAITFLSTPGQGYVDGMRFVQFYFGLPLAMIVIAAVIVPIYRRMNVITAYEYLETRFDGKTRSLAALLFLIQRGLAAGLTIYAPSLILSVLLGWNLYWTNLITGVLVVSYTASGGARAVNHTQFQQFLIIIGGMAVAFALILRGLPPGIGIGEATGIAGALGRMNAIDLSFDLENRYNIWSGLIGGFFLQLSYFGTDQSQVGRYLTGRSVAQSRLSLLFNGVVKVPMQFVILFLGAMVFVFYQFTPPPVFFNPAEVRKLRAGQNAEAFAEIESRHLVAFEARRATIERMVQAEKSGDAIAAAGVAEDVRAAHERMQGVRGEAVALMKAGDPRAQTSDTNYIFLTFVLTHLPAGVVGMVLAAIFAASMSSTSAELNALASTTVVDVYRRIRRRRGGAAGAGADPGLPGADAAAQAAAVAQGVATDRHEVRVSRWSTLLWGAFAIGFAQYAERLGSLIEAINILGSLFYGTILGIFLTAFFLRRVGGNAVFVAALIAEAVVVGCYFFSGISFLWYNVVGCLLVMGISQILQPLLGGTHAPRAPGTATS